MTSVLYNGGLNYQGTNPVRNEINKVNALISELRKTVDSQVADINTLKARVNLLEKGKSAVPTNMPSGAPHSGPPPGSQ